MTNSGVPRAEMRPRRAKARQAEVGHADEECATQEVCRTLCVDLDGTLVQTDMMLETALSALKRNPLRLLKLPYWMFRGRAHVKRELARLSEIDPAILPYFDPLLDYLREQRERGRRLVLVTASDGEVASNVADHLGLFDEIMASDGTRNLKGSAKAKALLDRFAGEEFAYAGNSRADIAVWREARAGVLVGVTRAVAEEARGVTPIETEFRQEGSHAKALAGALRPYQWAKNLLVFLPLVTGHALPDQGSLLAACVMFGAFCAAASGAYVINDILDLEADRRHPRKRNRPFASGTLPLAYGLLGPALLALGLILGAWLSRETMLVLLLYVGLSTAYSTWLKNQPLVDVFLLATLYSLRIFGGGVAAGVPVSIWLLGFSSFLFLSLAILKRISELDDLERRNVESAARRGYDVTDTQILQTMGVSSGFVSCVVLSLYVESDVAGAEYATPWALWGLVPLMLFWLCRMYLSTTRGYMHDDPIVYAAKDWVSWLVVAAGGAVYTVASLGVPVAWMRS